MTKAERNGHGHPPSESPKATRSGPAAALRFSSQSIRAGEAPRICQIAQGDEAVRAMLRDARRYGIEIISDSQLAGALSREPVNSEIPEELYSSVAEYFIRLRLW